MNKGILSMKKALSLVIILCQIMLYCPAAGAMQQSPLTDEEITISMDFKDADLKDILKVFSMQSGLNFVASEGVQDRKVTLYFDNVPLEEAINQLFKANNLTYEMDRSSNIFLVKDWGKPQLETVTKVFYLKYATVSTSSLKQQKDDAFESDSSGSSDSSSSSGGSSSSGSKGSSGSKSSTSSSGSGSDNTETAGITDAITQILTKEGNIIEDARTNSLIITDVPSRMPIITQVVAALDIPVPQIMLEVEMLDVSKNTVDQMGVKWPQTLAAFDGTRLARATAFPFSQEGMGYNPQGGNRTLNLAAATASAWTTAAWPASRFGPAIVSVINGQIALDYLRTQTDTKYLARPRILTLNNETAEIKISTNEAIGYEQQQTGSVSPLTTQAAIREETGVILKVTPQVNLETGEITMFIAPKVKDASTSSISTANNPLKDPEERSTKSLVRIRDGETVIIGGLIRNQKSQIDTELPGLAKIPVLGALFRHKNKDKDIERELLVFITPHIIKDNSVLELANKKSFVMPDRDQQAGLSAIDRQSAISASLNNFDKYRK